MDDKKKIAKGDAEEKKVAAENEAATAEAKKPKAADEKDEKKADAKKIEVKADADAEKTEAENEQSDDNIDVDKLFRSRRSVPLTPENARFFRSAGNLVSLELKNSGEDAVDHGEIEVFERVIILRSFPISNPDEFLSVREPDSREKGRGKEIGMIRRIGDFDPETVKIINDELALRYFTPEITKILNVKEKFGYSYWETETTAGKVTFVLDNPFSNIRILEDGRVFISDMDGNAFTVPDPSKLDKASFRRIEIYI
jgi:hypothetical protein